MLKAVGRKHPDSVAVLAFSDRFCNRPLLVQLPLFAKLVHLVWCNPRDEQYPSVR